MQEQIIEGFELSPQQQHLWRLMQQHQDGYCVQWVLEFSGAVVSAELAAALRRVSARHEILRTALRGGRAGSFPLQVILDRVELNIREVELRASGSSLGQECEQERQRPFDYEAGEGVRLCLARLASGKDVLIVTMSGLYGDLETMGQLVAELARNYEGAADGEEERLQYAEVAQWQHELLASGEGEQGRQYWQQQRASQESHLAQEESSGRSSGIERAEWELEEKLAAGVRRVASLHEAKVWEVLLASWQVLVWRLSGEQDGVIEVRVDGRKYELLAGVLGPLARYVPLRYHFERDYRFEEVLDLVKGTLKTAQARQGYFSCEDGNGGGRIGFEQLQWPVFAGLNGLSGSVIAVHDWTDQFKLKLSWVEKAGGGKILLSYDTALYQRASIERIGAEFRELLSSIVANPRELVSKLNLLSEAEREQVLHEWNQTTSFTPARCLHDIFSEQARQHPESPALLYEDEQMSYSELERRANQLAHHLQRLGVGPEVLVGICLERTPQLVVALLAVLKAGGAYLPLDPAYPAERLSFMLEDAAVTVLLSERELLTQLAPAVEHCVCLDEEWEQISIESEAAPECAAVPENLAYVIYTSGSTGQPKGVMITHANVWRLFQATAVQWPCGAADVWALFHSYAFDFSVWELWGALLHGGRLVIVPYWSSRTPAALLELLRAQQVTVLCQTPSAFQQLIQEGSWDDELAVRSVIFGGEALEAERLGEWAAQHAEVQLVNMYGITETTVHVTYSEVREEEIERRRAGGVGSAIGRGLADLEVYLLDEELQPVPVGVPGEICIGGAGLGRGYLQRAGLTAARFIPDAFSGRVGARLYRSGDVGRYLADGRIEYRGRLDQQVKVRGFRIELGEIEAVLGQHEAVAQCVVSLRETESGDKRLVGYVVWESGQEVTVAELREYLSERLPEYMVPGQWVVLEQLPLTASGKVDRRALPAPGMGELVGEQYVAPRTATEEIVAGIWAEVLEVEPVGVHDNFFDLGGHSLLATQVMSRAQEAFAVELPLRSLFERPTVGGLAAQIETALKSEERVSLPPLRVVEHEGEIPLSFAQQRLWFLDQLEPNNPFYNIPGGVRLSGELNVEALERTLSEIVRRHEALRTSFISVAGEPRQVIGPATEIKLPVEDLSELPLQEREQEAVRLAREEARQPFDLSRGPLLRARLLRLAADDHVLLVTMHHIVSDGWSMGVLVREVSALYEAYCAGAESPLPELMIQYADFAVWQRQWLSGDVLEEQLSYWREQLRDLNTLEMPADRVRPAVQSYRGAMLRFVVDREKTTALKELSRREGATLFMVLLAAFQVLLSRYSGQREIVIGSPIANRNHTGTEGLIGFFVNMLALRLNQEGQATFQQFLKHVREVCLQAYAHQDVPFERLVEELQPERDLSRSPLFQAAMVLQNAPLKLLELSSVQLGQVIGDSGAAKYDLLLELHESNGILKGTLEYATDLFDAGTMERLLEHFQELLRAVTAAPELPLTQVSMLSAAERAQLLHEWNQTTSFTPARCLHDIFSEQARQHPQSPALLYEDEQLSYGELERRANQLAHHLQRLGVGPEVLVGICLERTPQLVVALLAVLKAGGAYLPLDPAYPAERLSFMLEDAAVTVLLSERELLTQLAPQVEHCVCLDEEWEQIAIESEAAPECAAVPENLAYVIYTSGSTGQPKGVMITHANVWRLFQATAVQWPCGAADVWALFHSYAFDFSVWELWGALLHGGRLVIVPYWSSRTPAALLELLRAQQVTVLCQTPSAFQQLIQEGSWDDELAVRAVIFGGEALEAERLGEWAAQHAGVQLVNMYGITETTVHVTYSEVGAEEIERRRAGGVGSAIGRGLVDLEVYLLDEELQPVPVGVPGEICVGGAGLGRGYLQRAGLTAARFIPDAFSGRAGARLYRSGDVGRYLADGRIEYRGRLDQQVKVRGFRIELGEIEAVLGQHEAVAQCVVSLRETESGDKRLVAYVVQDPSHLETSEQSKEWYDQHVAQWQMLYDGVYSDVTTDHDSIFNVTGWNSSYTGQPIPDEEMQEWLSQTVKRILSLKPSRVLEIGCGTGLLLFRLAEQCELYWGTDFSQVALDHVERHLALLDHQPKNVSLFRKAAEDFENIPEETFDVVILNSVVQYFPTIEYLFDVLKGAVNAVRPNGSIFIGDVRNLSLLEAFHTSVQLYQSAPSATTTQLQQRIQRHMGQEEELLIDPEFFRNLKHFLPQVSEVEIQLKRGSHQNEMNRFRYDVVLHVKKDIQSQNVDSSLIDWQTSKLNLSSLHHLLVQDSPATLVITQIPNLRLLEDTRAIELLRSNDRPATVSELREILERTTLNGWADPEELCRVGDRLSYDVRISYSRSDALHCYDAVFTRAGENLTPVYLEATKATPAKSINKYANNPLREKFARKLVPRLREYLQQKLPDHMVPGQWMVLSALPLTASGKVDRKALPAPEQSELVSEQYVAPRTATEEIVAGIWAEVLEVKQVGIHDNFFELGGHSLLATQVISRARETFGIELPLRSLFEAPTVGSLSRSIEQFRLAGMQTIAPPLMPRDTTGEDEIPLSYAQQRLWFLDQLEPNNPFYNIPTGVRLSGELNIEALERTFSEIVRRHEVLRTSFVSVAGEPRQVIGAPLEIRLPLEDLSHLPVREREQEAERRAGEEAREPFDLSRGPLLRARLIRLAVDEHVLLVTMHHIVSDGWSMGVLVREVSALYEAYCTGAKSPLPELAIQYADFAVWQRQWLSGDVLDQQLSYWREQLQGLRTLELPADRVRPAVQSYRGALLRFSLGRKETAALRELSRREGATLFMVVLAAFQVLLSRYSGQSEVVIGTDVANRNHAGTEGLIGFFVNQLVLRTELRGARNFVDVVRRAREICLEAYANQDVPFEKLVEELQPERDMSRSPLFQVKLALQNAPGGTLEMEHLSLSSVAGEGQTAKYDLMLALGESDDGLSGALEYNTDLFDRATIVRLHDHFQQLLRAVTAAPELPLTQVSILTAAEREQLLHEWNQTTTYLPPVCLHELFAEQARQRPEATALIYKDEQLSYGELERRANQLAHHLQRLGVGPEVVVGICLERTPQLIVALLAVLKAGGAYLPLDPEYPPERLSFMLEDARVKVLLTESSVVERMPAHWGDTLCLDEEWEQIASASEAAPACTAGPENLAYVMYTSGSTGEPKGVMITHRNIVRLLWESDYAQLDQQQTILQLAPIAFDASTFEVWGALLHGAQLQLYPGRVASAAELSEILVPGRHWTLWLTASLFNAVVDEQVQALSAVEQLLVGGEALSVGHIRRAQQELRAVQLINGYGPTEGTTFACCYRLPEEVEATAASIPIGRPIGNTEVYILDAEMQPVPVGVHGELYIGGVGVARGYLQRAGLTAEKFVPHPFSAAGGARLYRTGDECRYLADGRIEYRGRLDQQVKVRGYRIELGEVETVLGQQAAVAQCVVNVWATESGDKRLVGYVVWEAGQEATATELREYLSERLPEYMVPGQWVVLDELPLTANGKVDRSALPGPEPGEMVGEQYLAPRTATEEIVAGIWAAVLEVEQVGVQDNFFELGGHSLLATQVVSRLREAFAVELPLRSLFEHATVKGLAAQIDAALKSEERLSLPPLRVVEHDGEIPLSFAQQRLWFLDQLEPYNPFYNIPAGVRLSGELNVEALERTLSEIVRRHEVLRTSFRTEVGEPRQVIGPATEIKLPIDDLSDLPEEQREAEAARFAGAEARQSFDLSCGPLLRARLLRVATDEHVLLVTMHHIVSDGWSMGVLVREVSALYQAYCAGAQSPLPELAIQYADFAVWQRHWLSGAVLEEQLSYWREQLRDLSTLELPTDRVRPAVQSYKGATVPFALSREETAVLKELSRREGATLFMVLLSAFHVLLSRYSGQTDVVIGTPIANRNRAETEELIGLFVNTLALRINVDGNPNFKQLLKQVREICLGAYAHQDLPFEKLVEELQPERDLSRSPLFQVMLTLQNTSSGTLQMGNLSLSSVGGEGHTAKYDLLLNLTETDTGLTGNLEYSTDLFEARTVVRMLEHFQQLLRAVSTTPDLPLLKLSMLSPTEREQLHAWNQTATYFPPVCLHELFAEQARKHPEATALIYEDEELSYAELERRANQLAHHLRRLGVGPEVVVAVLMERSVEMVVSLLATHKAGGAYLPLDPTYPLERLAFLMDHAGARVVLSQRRFDQLLPGEETPVVFVDEGLEADTSGEPLDSSVTPANAAYVIYTSGSTGEPKGVMNTHAGICNRLLWMQETYRLTNRDRVLQKTPFTFDVSVWEFFWPLITGAALVVARPEGHREPSYLVELIKTRQITTIHFVPSMLQSFLGTVGVESCTSLRQVFSSGEALTRNLEQEFFKRVNSELHNLYGPTEAAVDVSFWACERGAKHEQVPIGKPIANTELYVLNKELELVPCGVVGEIHIGGAGLARGYLHAAALTAEKFIPDPFSGRAGARLYRTGDQGRYLEDGNIEYRGRLDQQVKLRGYRIELGEIEAVLGQHEAVAQCVVNVLAPERGEKRLVGYVVWEPEHETTVQELRRYLSGRLPEYMVPGQWVVLEELPLTTSGKVNRKALPAPALSELLGKQYVAPRTATEETLARIWSEVLDVERVGIHDNFFDLGGDSIISVQVVARAAQANIHLAPRQLFSHQTVAALATVAETSAATEIEQGLVTGPLPLTPIQRSFFDRGLVDAHHYNHSVMFEVDPTVDASLLEQATQNLVRHHDALRIHFVNSGSGWQQINAVETKPVFAHVDLSPIAKTDQAQAIEARAAEFQASLNLTDGPLIRIVLFDLGSGESGRLLIVIHHLVIDGVSWRILLEDLQTVYQQLSNKNDVQLMPKTASFKYWAEKLNEHAHSPAVRSELDYWLSEPRRNIERLPVDFSDGANTVASARHLSTSLTTEETQTLLHEVPKIYGTPINDALLTALAQCLVAWTGRSSMLVDLEGHGREEIGVNIDLTRTVGWFTTMFPVLLDLTGVFTLEDALKRINEQLRNIPNKGIGYGLLRYLSGDEKVMKELASLPQASISFNYLGQLDQMLMNSALLKGAAAESSGPPLSSRQERGHLLELTGMIANGRLQITWTYSENVHRRETIDRIAQKYTATLQSLIAHSKTDKARGYTPADFPKAGLSQSELDKLLARVGKAKGSYR